VQALHLGEGAAYKHVWAVRLARRYPHVLHAIAEGRVHLSGICELARHLTSANAPELIEAATHKTRREIQLMIAERFPKPDAPTLVMALPGAGVATTTSDTSDSATSESNVMQLSCKPSPGKVSPGDDGSVCSLQAIAPAYPRITPIAPARFAMQLTINQETHDLIERAKDLLAHARPGCDVAQVLELALAEFVEKLEKRKFGDTHAPKARRALGDSRYIPSQVKRRVAERDCKRCTFVSEKGVRCAAREMLEFDHVKPVARGGRSTVDNVRLRCRAHNQLEAERTYGAGFMDRKRGHGVVRERPRCRHGHWISGGWLYMREAAARAHGAKLAHGTRTKARAVGVGAGPVRPVSRTWRSFAQACMRCCDVPWPRMPLMRSTSLRGLNGLVM
jgi:hypothetical protein